MRRILFIGLAVTGDNEDQLDGQQQVVMKLLAPYNPEIQDAENEDFDDDDGQDD